MNIANKTVLITGVSRGIAGHSSKKPCAAEQSACTRELVVHWRTQTLA